MRIILPARPPFSLTSVINSHGWAQLAPFIWQRETGDLARVHRLSTGRVVRLDFSAAADGLATEVSEGLIAAERAELAGDLDWMFGLAMDFTPFYQLVRGEAKLAGVEEQARGRVLRSPTLWEDTVKTILTTNTAWSGTIRMTRALVEQFGEPWPSDPALKAFPTPDTVAASDPDTLRNVTRLGYRAPYIHILAEEVATGRLDMAALRDPQMPTTEVRRRLLAIKGVGGYAAANLLMILGRYDQIPIDSYAMGQVSREWYDGQPVGSKEVEAAFERWGAWKGLVFWFWEWSG